jgi:transcriptional regulator with XRE-family HTH domain
VIVPTSPTAWRRWLAKEMRRKRREAGLEQRHVADALRSTVTKVSYVENGERSFKLRDLTEVLLPLYGVPEAEWGPFLDACKLSRERGWWQRYPEDIVPDWFVYYVGLEQGARALRGFEMQYILGLFQTPDYVTALMRHDPSRLTEDEVAARFEVRRKRQSVLTREPEPLDVDYVLDEATLRRVVGSREIMHAQVNHLADLAGRPNITLRVLPFSQGPHPDLSGSFAILEFPWEDDPGVVYVEGRATADYLERPHELEDYKQVFAELRELALPPDASVDMLRRVAKDHR